MAEKQGGAGAATAILVAIIGTIGAVGAAWVASHNHGSEHHAPKNPGAPTMGPLEMGINLQGDDYDAYGKPAANAELCLEICRVDDRCMAVTYVIPTQRCWPKTIVPPPADPGGPAYVSAIKNQG